VAGLAVVASLGANVNGIAAVTGVHPSVLLIQPALNALTLGQSANQGIPLTGVVQTRVVCSRLGQPAKPGRS
jgi:hypothetical protein